MQNFQRLEQNDRGFPHPWWFLLHSCNVDAIAPWSTTGFVIARWWFRPRARAKKQKSHYALHVHIFRLFFWKLHHPQGSSTRNVDVSSTMHARPHCGADQDWSTLVVWASSIAFPSFLWVHLSHYLNACRKIGKLKYYVIVVLFVGLWPRVDKRERIWRLLDYRQIHDWRMNIGDITSQLEENQIDHPKTETLLCSLKNGRQIKPVCFLPLKKKTRTILPQTNCSLLTNWRPSPSLCQHSLFYCSLQCAASGPFSSLLVSLLFLCPVSTVWKTRQVQNPPWNQFFFWAGKLVE